MTTGNTAQSKANGGLAKALAAALCMVGAFGAASWLVSLVLVGTARTATWVASYLHVTPLALAAAAAGTLLLGIGTLGIVERRRRERLASTH